jgi:NAD(P)-dependent dehydrogenase (short-subunit alcohol dehydrogenase family)
MQKPKVLITAAAGKTGMATAMDLLREGFPVRAMVRRTDARSQCLKDAGAEIIVGSLEDFTDSAKAMNGVQRAYFCPPLEPGTLRRATLFAACAEEARLEAVALLSLQTDGSKRQKGIGPSSQARQAYLGRNRVLRVRDLNLLATTRNGAGSRTNNGFWRTNRVNSSAALYCAMIVLKVPVMMVGVHHDTAERILNEFWRAVFAWTAGSPRQA